jgi:hypothetical protein
MFIWDHDSKKKPWISFLNQSNNEESELKKIIEKLKD